MKNVPQCITMTTGSEPSVRRRCRDETKSSPNLFLSINHRGNRKNINKGDANMSQIQCNDLVAQLTVFKCQSVSSKRAVISLTEATTPLITFKWLYKTHKNLFPNVKWIKGHRRSLRVSYSGLDLSQIFHSLLCKSYQTATVPTLWKTAIINTLPNKPRPTDLNHYLPVAASCRPTTGSPPIKEAQTMLHLLLLSTWIPKAPCQDPLCGLQLCF